METFEYGSMSSLFSCEAENKLTAYATACLHYQNNAFAIVFYKPEYCKEDSWLSFDGKISDRLDEVFGGAGSFDKYLEGHVKEIQACYKSIKRIS